MINLNVIASSIGIIQAIIFILLISAKKSVRSTDKVLLFWFFTFCIHLGLILVIDVWHSRLVLVLAKSLVLLHGPFFLLYTRSVFGLFDKRQFIHFSIFIIFLTSGLLISDGSTAQVLEVILALIKLLTLIVYPTYIRIWLKSKVLSVKNRRADSFLLDIQWIKSLAYLMLAYAGIGFLHILSELVLGFTFSSALDLFIYALMITVIGFLGLKFGKLYVPDLSADTASKPYKHSPLKQDEIKSIKVQINDYFDSTHDYLNPDYALSHLSDRVGIPKHHLSEVINLEMDTTFYDIVNAKRVQFAKESLQSENHSHLTLEGIGYACGFNTKSAFYHHFKNLTGQTPGQYKAQIRPD